MAGFGKVDFSDLIKLQKQLEALSKDKTQEYLEYLTKDLASITLSKAIFRTPTISGHLKRGWTGGREMTAHEWVDEQEVKHNGNVYTLTISNAVEYAPYVEYGHRQEPGRYVSAIGKRLVKKWVNGQYMCTKAVLYAKSRYPIIAKRDFERWMNENFKF